jgi:hypothetical protein
MLLGAATVPVYVTTPTATKLIELPVTLPLICSVSRGDDSAITPMSAEPLFVHLSTNVPLKVPLYCPVHVPDRSKRAAGVGVGMGVGVAVAVAAGVGVLLVVDALHPPSAIAARATVRARNLLPNIDLASSGVAWRPVRAEPERVDHLLQFRPVTLGGIRRADPITPLLTPPEAVLLTCGT